jgi:MFS transporter, MHS family, alpha-ketoglutarate permease
MTTAAHPHHAHGIGATDTRRRIWAIVGGSSGNLVLSALAHVSDAYAAFGLVILALAGVSFYTSISGLVKAELFPMHVRALGVGLSYAIANALFGGSAEYVALWLKSIGMESTFFWYVTTMCGIALVAAITMPDTRRQGHMTEDETKLMEV